MAVSDLDASASVDCIAVCTLPLPSPLLSLFALPSRFSFHFPKVIEPPPPNQSRLHLTPRPAAITLYLLSWALKGGFKGAAAINKLCDFLLNVTLWPILFQI